MVFYRKYRPQTFAQLVGQDHVKQSLQKSLEQGNVAHAYLFCGPRGCGKTTTARILAKALNCEKLSAIPKNASSNSFEPCNKCTNCVAIQNGSHIDVIEIDAASHRGIDDIRELKERISLAPGLGRKKVYIIDEVHMLTTEAFNALLKTLEEPPEHATLILATTEPQKIPATIISRCQRFDFSLASALELKQALATIIQAEKLTVTDDCLDFLAQKAEGSYRDGVKYLDQIASVGQPITLDLITQTMQLPKLALVEQFFDYLTNGQEGEALAFIDQMYQKGENLQQFTLLFLRFVRDIFYIADGVGEKLVKLVKPAAIYKKMQIHANAVTKANLIQLLTIFSQKERDQKYTSIPQLPLELGVIEFLDKQISHRAIAPLSLPKPEEIAPVKQFQPTAVTAIEKPVIKPEEVGAMLASDSDSIVMEEAAASDVAQIAPKIKARSQVATVSATDSASKDLTVATLTRQWPEFMQLCLEKNHSAALLLKNATIAGLTDNILLLEVAYKFHKERLEQEKIRQFLEGILEEVYGLPILIAVSLSKRQKKIQDTEELADTAMQIFGGEMIE